MEPHDSAQRPGSIRLIAGADFRIKVVDIGASAEDGSPPPYKGLLAIGDVDLVGFEPHAESLAALTLKKGPFETYLPHVIADGARHTLNLCFGPGMTSLLTPNLPTLSLFHLFPIWAQIRATEIVDTVRLDDVPETDGADFIKIDIQGAELLALSHGLKRLRDVCIIQIEVNFVPMYVGQPLFSEIEQFLRHNGFMFHRFLDSEARMLRPMVIDDNPHGGMSQLVWADGIFVRDLARLDLYSDRQLLVAATILHDCYRSFDAALMLLFEYDERNGTKVHRSYGALLRHHLPNRKFSLKRLKLADAPQPKLS